MRSLSQRTRDMKQQKKYVWKKLSRETQDHYIRLLWKDGYSEGAIADFFGVGKGVIVRRRQSHLTDLKPRARHEVKSELNLERFEDLLEIEKMDDMKDRGIEAIAPVTEAAAPALQAQQTTRDSATPIETGRKIRADKASRRAAAVSAAAKGSAPAIRPKLAASEATQCANRDGEGRRCAYEWRDACTRLCVLHSK